ncbi:MAG: phosphodiester glycosidase family protein, partial [Armatimonadetes bacterium]|nr:phosphodiester glycosidase family protein [Armatimonadota bacterium]
MPGDPLNLQIIKGELVSEPSERIVFGMTSDRRFLFDRLEFDAKITLSDGKWFPIRGINRGRADNEMIAYTSRFADSTRTSNVGSDAIVKCECMPVKLGVPIKGVVCEVRSKAGNTAILEDCVVLSGAGTGSRFIEENLKPGISVTLEFQVKGSRTGSWQKVSDAVGGCPWLVRDGKQFIDAKEEGSGAGFYAGVHPRTAVGVTKDGKLIIVTVDGRQSVSGGMTLAQLADVMLSQGCIEAANLDGGGSTTMATAFGILNSPSSGIPRAVANGLAVFGNPSSSVDVEFAVSTPSPVPSGTTTQLCLLDSSTGQPLNADVANRAIWSTTGGMGFVDQSGRFYGVKARSGNVIVKLASKTVSIPVQTIP